MRILELILLAVVALASHAEAGEWKSLDGTTPETTPSPRSSGSPAVFGIKNSADPQRAIGGNVTDPDTALAMMAEKYKNAVGIVVRVGESRQKKWAQPGPLGRRGLRQILIYPILLRSCWTKVSTFS